MERVSIYVDGANMYYAQKRLGWFIDFRKLITYFRAHMGMKVSEAYYYTAVDPLARNRDTTFHDYLLHSGYVLRTRPLKGGADGHPQEEVPWERIELAVDMTVDMLLALYQYDTCAILSGDGNFERIVEALRAKCKRVMIFAHPDMTARELRNVVGLNFFDLRDLEMYVARTDRLPDAAAHHAEAIKPAHLDASG
ncbi:MAG: NYN domain-containing protein [Fimbriimonadia bacterium]|nr:NYN domain-containing protein [Fimbriimonadia bacterium]